MRHACFLPAVLALLLSPLCFSAADDWSITPAARDGSSTANSRVLVIPNIIRKQTGYLTVTNNSCDHFAIVAAGSPSNPCGGITVSNFARHNRCRSPDARMRAVSPEHFFRQMRGCSQRRRFWMVEGLAHSSG